MMGREKVRGQKGVHEPGYALVTHLFRLLVPIRLLCLTIRLLCLAVLAAFRSGYLVTVGIEAYLGYITSHNLVVHTCVD